MLLSSVVVLGANSTSVTVLAAPKVNPYKVIQAESNFGTSGVEVKTEGDYYVITPESWNTTVRPGDGAYFGIIGTGSIGNSISYVLE